MSDQPPRKPTVLYSKGWWIVLAILFLLMLANQGPEQSAQTGANTGQVLGRVTDGLSDFLGGLTGALNRNSGAVPAPAPTSDAQG